MDNIINNEDELLKKIRNSVLIIDTYLRNKKAISNPNKIIKNLNENISSFKYLDEQKENTNNQLEIKSLFNNGKVALLNNYLPNKYDSYIQKLLDYSISILDDLNHWINEKDYYMCAANLKDVKDVFKVADFLYQDLPAKAYNKASNLDTYIRDGFDNVFWDEFILGNDLKDLEKYQKIVKQKENLEKVLQVKPSTKTVNKI